MSSRGWKSLTSVLVVALMMMVAHVHESECFRSAAAVSILSSTGSGSYVRVRCQSGDDDLGTRILEYGQLWHWEISPKIKGRSLSFCSFSWWNDEEKEAMHAVFPVWSMNVVRTYSNCFDPAAWKVEKDGFWFYKPRSGSQWEKRHDWNTLL